MSLPTLTAEQRAQALEKATQARRRRAEVKAQLKSGELLFSQALKLAETDEAIAKMRMSTLLESLPRVGVTTAASLMESYGIAQSRRVRGLGSVQKEQLIKRFG